MQDSRIVTAAANPFLRTLIEWTRQRASRSNGTKKYQDWQVRDIDCRYWISFYLSWQQPASAVGSRTKNDKSSGHRSRWNIYLYGSLVGRTLFQSTTCCCCRCYETWSSFRESLDALFFLRWISILWCKGFLGKLEWFRFMQLEIPVPSIIAVHFDIGSDSDSTEQNQNLPCNRQVQILFLFTTTIIMSKTSAWSSWSRDSGLPATGGSSSWLWSVAAKAPPPGHKSFASMFRMALWLCFAWHLPPSSTRGTKSLVTTVGLIEVGSALKSGKKEKPTDAEERN